VSDSVDILVIDDNDVQLEYMTDLLTQKGFTVKTSTESLTAVKMMLKINPKVVILDIMMPHLDGYSILKNMRDQKSLAKVPVIIYTGKSYPIDEKKARDLGANSYLVKPVKGSVIIEEIKKYI
jgi:two-component system chemotaxis response regulator CheY